MNYAKNYKVGDIIRAEVDKFPGYFTVYKVSKTGIKNDGQGQTQLETLMEQKRYQDGATYYLPKQREITVDHLWFNEDLTGRKITIVYEWNITVMSENGPDHYEGNMEGVEDPHQKFGMEVYGTTKADACAEAKRQWDDNESNWGKKFEIYDAYKRITANTAKNG